MPFAAFLNLPPPQYPNDDPSDQFPVHRHMSESCLSANMYDLNLLRQVTVPWIPHAVPIIV